MWFALFEGTERSAEATWSDPLCVQQDVAAVATWSEPVCVQANMPVISRQYTWEAEVACVDVP